MPMRRPTASEIVPMSGLVTTAPVLMIQPTTVSAAPSRKPGAASATAKAAGTMVALPNPARANPGMTAQE